MNFVTYSVCKLSYKQLKIEHALFNKFYQIENPRHEKIISIPDGCINVWFLKAGTYYCAKVIGSANTGKLSLISNYDKCFGIKFNSGVVPDIFRQDIHILVANNILLEKYQKLDFMIQKIMGMPSFEEKVSYSAACESYFSTKSLNPTILTALKDIHESYGNIKVADVAIKLGYCSRHINEIFRKNTGFSIKQYAQIIRIQQAIDELKKTGQNDIYSNLGFYDQSHFLKEFKRLTLLTPRSIKDNNWEFT